MLYHYFASTAGSVPSLMALGYKHMYGLGVPKSCDTAFSYYNPAAEQVRPAQNRFFFCASVCAAPTLNAASQPRVTLSLR